MIKNTMMTCDNCGGISRDTQQRQGAEEHNHWSLLGVLLGVGSVGDVSDCWSRLGRLSIMDANCAPLNDSVGVVNSCYTVNNKPLAVIPVENKALAVAAVDNKPPLPMRMDDHLIWCDNMKETLIREFCQSECLWNPKDKNYRCHRWKKVVMTQIARKMSIIYAVRITGYFLISFRRNVAFSWNMLRDQFRRAKRTGKDQWRFYEHLLFLDSVDFNRDSTYWTDTSLSISSICEASQAAQASAHSYSQPNTPYQEVSSVVKEEFGTNTTATATVSTISLASALENLQALAKESGENTEPCSEIAEMDRLSDTQSEGKSTAAERKRAAGSPSCSDVFAVEMPPRKRSAENNSLLSQQIILPKMEADDQFTHFARTVEMKLRLIYQMSPADGVRLQKRISDAIFEKEMEFIEKSAALTSVHNLFS
ncbi:unnamed protein product [Toxocara canis]|uniref:MADF domain-containing protein n=1 Tax=Toxocara canis TaxID=6265 RepID=A0A183VCK7_TOXCA|nr:unnamed protein product [Toxocara canis]